MLRLEGSGLTGLFITILLYLGTIVISSLALYEYLLHVHKDGRILDLWRRITGNNEEFFIPGDYEISGEELQYVLNKAKYWKGPKASRKKIEITEGVDRDPDSQYFMGIYKHIMIYEVSPNSKPIIFRQFQIQSSGVISEIFHDAAKLRAKKRIFHNFKQSKLNMNNESPRGEISSVADEENLNQDEEEILADHHSQDVNNDELNDNIAENDEESSMN